LKDKIKTKIKTHKKYQKDAKNAKGGKITLDFRKEQKRDFLDQIWLDLV